MEFDGALGDAEDRTDLPVGLALLGPTQHLALALGQLDLLLRRELDPGPRGLRSCKLERRRRYERHRLSRPEGQRIRAARVRGEDAAVRLMHMRPDDGQDPKGSLD